MNTVGEAVESFLAFGRKALPEVLEQMEGEAPHPPPREAIIAALDRASIFYMGELKDIKESTKEVLDDLNDDLSERMPMPFDEIVLLESACDDALAGYKPNVEPPLRAEFGDWGGTLVIKLSEKVAHPTAKHRDRCYFVLQAAHHARLGWKVQFAASFEYAGMMPNSMMEIVLHAAVLTQRFGDARRGIDEKTLAPSLVSVMTEVALISHPMNYIVRESPSLTPREERRAREGKNVSDQKRPRYIVVDHDVLVSMQAPGGGTHASPVPHRRRGHWRRLAERCQLARSRGEERIFVRPAYVGKKEFVVGANKYQVLMDFRDRPRAMAAPITEP